MIFRVSLIALCIFGYSVLTTDSKESVRSKRAKRPRAPSIQDFRPEPKQNLDELREEPQPVDIPIGFLSPSVREYLELGRSIPGRPGTDYPILSAIPYTNFYCDDQPYPGFFADMDTRCQGWHYCDIDGRQASFLCPNGTQFSQAVFVCDWWFNVRCDLSPRLYAINARLYQTPKVNPTRPHRIITKQLIDDIFN
ncbi:uncharacterized protein LOC129787258 [Lutzomyia longipalpis]|uniref:uncharacterized protein LOC129787258 n=1 Tax=Lutzomyia longipalpis TaxID=7200 RepID=UPI002483BA57|nr:uncharacterized protein LOC129787258 [Lutzomyia longipalpis]XP_055678676.1 uncharacterized protein LOC129787258 [Lutzomyia longipalpis]